MISTGLHNTIGTLKSIITLTLNDIEKDVEKTYRQYSHLKSRLVTSDIMKKFHHSYNSRKEQLI